MVVEERARKVTFVMPERVVREMRRVVEEGRATSQNALVRVAVERELDRLRDEQYRRDLQEMMLDPEFVKEIHDTMEAFAFADAESARMIPDA